jgi:DNA polymerase-4
MPHERWIMHVDMDAFFASVEQLDHPEYRGKPVIVGGQSGRGVVSTASYEARKYGIHSAMPMVQAHKLCPHGIFVAGRHGRYEEISERIRAIFHEFSPLVEPISIDEAFLDLTGMEKITQDLPALARKIKERIKKETGLTASIGLAPNKFLAKLASDLEKPDGLVVIRPEEAAARIAPLPISRIFGVGRHTVDALKQIGLTTIGQLAACNPAVLRPLLGKNAETIINCAHGLDNRPVICDEKRQSLGREMTFEEDLCEKEDCLAVLWDLSQQVGWRLREKGLGGYTVTLKVKTSDFKLHTRSVTAETPLQLDEEIFDHIRHLASSFPWSQPVRLLGVTISHLSDQPDGIPPFFEAAKKNRQRSAALDALKKRFGEHIIHKGQIKE